MYPTLEVRWFFRERVPPDVETWFHTGAARVEQQEPRSDHYLPLPDTGGLNVKMREGRIEIKQRVGEAKAMQFHERVTGLVEQWRKWSFALAEPGHAWLRTVSPASPWLAVRKERRMRTYAVQDREVVPAETTAKPPVQGCEQELTVVHVAGEIWWTLAFEAFGDEATLRDSLTLVARHVLCRAEPPSLSVRDSFGYAAWLSSIDRSEAP